MNIKLSVGSSVRRFVRPRSSGSDIKGVHGLVFVYFFFGLFLSLFFFFGFFLLFFKCSTKEMIKKKELKPEEYLARIRALAI